MAKETKATDVRLKSADELGAMLLDLRKEQFNLRFQRASGQTEGVGRVRQVRRDIARVKTIMVEKKNSTAADGAKCCIDVMNNSLDAGQRLACSELERECYRQPGQ